MPDACARLVITPQHECSFPAVRILLAYARLPRDDVIPLMPESVQNRRHFAAPGSGSELFNGHQEAGGPRFLSQHSSRVCVGKCKLILHQAWSIRPSSPSRTCLAKHTHTNTRRTQIAPTKVYTLTWPHFGPWIREAPSLLLPLMIQKRERDGERYAEH